MFDDPLFLKCQRICFVSDQMRLNCFPEKRLFYLRKGHCWVLFRFYPFPSPSALILVLICRPAACLGRQQLLNPNLYFEEIWETGRCNCSVANFTKGFGKGGYKCNFQQTVSGIRPFFRIWGTAVIQHWFLLHDPSWCLLLGSSLPESKTALLHN